MNLIRKALEEGRAFLQRADLRNIQAVTLLPAAAQDDIYKRLIENNKATSLEQDYMYDILYTWQGYCNSPCPGARVLLGRAANLYLQVREFYDRRSTDDDFAGCYFEDGTITAKGLTLRMESRRGNATV